MGVYERAEVEAICDKPRTSQRRVCYLSSTISAPMEMNGPAFYKARDELRKMGWTIRDDRTYCPNCTRNLIDDGKDPAST